MRIRALTAFAAFDVAECELVGNGHDYLLKTMDEKKAHEWARLDLLIGTSGY
jgi:hypothetical protein